ncbi:MAG: kelch repeat-containing protein, partial [Chitinophagaceae bacterium]
KTVWEALEINRGNLVNARVDKKTSPLGVIEISIVDKTQPASASFTLDNFKAHDLPGTASCNLKYQKLVVINPDDPDDHGTLEWVDDPSTFVSIAKIKDIKYPVITSFEAKQYIISKGETAEISWKSENTDYCNLDGSKVVKKRDRLKPIDFISETLAESGETKYALTAHTNDSVENYDDSKLTINVLDNSRSGIFVFLPPQSTLMGIYPYDDRLYAIVLHKNPQVKAYLYSSASGLMNWQQVFRYPDQPVELDVKLAGSPGVVFRNRLYLIGGSSFDPDKPGSDIGYYNFETKEWISSNQMKNTSFPPSRMGHSCIVYKDEIWLLGGYHPAQGTLSDIWTTKNGQSWAKAGITLPNGGGCMMGATIYKEELWIYGGFKQEPGGDSYSIEDTRKWDGKSWGTKLKWNVETEAFMKKLEYKACSLAVEKNSLFLFSTSRHSSLWEHNIFRIYEQNGWDASNEKTTNDWGMDQDGYSLQTIVYKSTIWIRAIRLAGSKDAGVAGKELYYYYYVPSNNFL